MAQIISALIGLVGGVIVAIIGAGWLTPDLIRLDVLFPTKEVKVLDDFVYVHFDEYREKDNDEPIEIYQNPYHHDVKEPVFDKATYVEYLWLRKTKDNYVIELTTTGAPPELKAISPELKERDLIQTHDGEKKITAELALDQNQEFHFSGKTPNPKTIYVYRNGYQGRNSWGGKNVRYDTDRLTFVYDFSALNISGNLFNIRPEACLKRMKEEHSRVIDIKWKNDVAIVEAFDLNKGDKVRVFWTWNRLKPDAAPFQQVTCKDAL